MTKVESASKGTPQFWKLFSACSGDGPDEQGSYGSKVLKGKAKTSATRIRNKLEILNSLKRRGIWLIDTSIIGWYIQQRTEYNITQKSQKIHKLQKARPPANMKKSTLILSWELYIKHVVRKATAEGNLKLLVPIGKEVNDIITQDRLKDAVCIDGKHTVDVHKGIPAPNAWVKGTGEFTKELVKLEASINKAIGSEINPNK